MDSSDEDEAASRATLQLRASDCLAPRYANVLRMLAVEGRLEAAPCYTAQSMALYCVINSIDPGPYP